MVEPWRGLQDYDFNGKQKYAFMHRHGGPGSWFFVPYIFCMTEILKQILNRLEQQDIQLYPMHLNNEQRHRRKKMTKRGQYSSLHSARGWTLPQSGAWNSRPAHTARLQLYYGNGTVLSSGVDPTLALETADNILIHSSLLILSPGTHIQRTLGQAMLQCYMLEQGMDTAQYTLAQSLRWAIKQPPGWVFITFITRVHKTLQRPLEYADLLHLARRKVSTNYLKATLLLNIIMWIMWGISRRELALPIHKMNTTQLTTVLRCRGFTLTPDRDLVIRIKQGTCNENASNLNLTKGSVGIFHTTDDNNYATMSSGLLESCHWQPERLASSVLITTKRWITKMYTAPLPCNCNLYPLAGIVTLPTWPYLPPLMVI